MRHFNSIFPKTNIQRVTIYGSVITLTGTSGTADITINNVVNTTALSFSSSLTATANNWVAANLAYYKQRGYAVSASAGVITVTPESDWDTVNRINATIANLTGDLTGILTGVFEPDFFKAKIWNVTFTMDSLVANPRNAVDGDKLDLLFQGTGSYTLTWESMWGLVDGNKSSYVEINTNTVRAIYNKDSDMPMALGFLLAAPSGLTLTLISGGVKVDWIDNSGGIAETEIWAQSDGGVSTLLITKDAGIETHSDILSPVDLRYYKIRSKVGLVYSVFTIEESIAMLGPELIPSSWCSTNLATFWDHHIDAHAVGDNTKITFDGTTCYLLADNKWVVGKTYRILMSVIRNSGLLTSLYDEGGPSEWIATSGNKNYTYTVDSGPNMQLYSDEFNGQLTALSVKEIFFLNKVHLYCDASVNQSIMLGLGYLTGMNAPVIYWGDGTSTTLSNPDTIEYPTHNYSGNDIYSIIITNASSLYYVRILGTDNSMEVYPAGGDVSEFAKCTNLLKIQLDKNLKGWKGSIDNWNTGITDIQISDNAPYAVTGDVSLFPSLTRIWVWTSLHGNLTGATGMKEVNFGGNETVTLDITDWYDIERLNNQYALDVVLTGSVTGKTHLHEVCWGYMDYIELYGDLSTCTALTYWETGGVNNHCTGDLTGLILINTFGDGSANNVFTGSIAGWTDLNYFSNTGGSNFTRPSTVTTQGKIAVFINSNWVFIETEVNQILADVWANRDIAKTGNSNRIFYLLGAAPTGQGIIDKANLQAYRSPNNDPEYALWTIETN